MLLPNCSKPNFKTKIIITKHIKYYSTTYNQLIQNSVENINQILEKNDRSSYILSRYIPEPARNTFMAIRAFNLEINKINEGGLNQQSIASKASKQMSQTLGMSTSDLKFKFWSDLLLRVFTDNNSTSDLGEPIAILLRDALNQNLNLDITYFQKFLQTRRSFIKNNASFMNTNEICSYGEGTYSQLNYLTQNLLLSPQISPSSIKLLENSTQLQSNIIDIAAHIGQATAIASMIQGLKYYATSRNQITLPIDLMNNENLSQESILKLFNGSISDEEEINEIKDKLKQVVYNTAIVANDHILTAQKKLQDFKLEVPNVVSSSNDLKLQKFSKNWKGKIPDSIFTPLMICIPTNLFLKKLEKNDFDILNLNFQQPEWRLAWISFKDYYQRKI
ncbi:uncharacterized protein KGF55_005295 [Candida pseudojiufengensis]|uniref:uncharacterized protein n=1 Tax=Candida pseudojiufengensis TaxID=497109 RepID=UPI002224B0F9|nr:uncharacterized protein KGF55_005295 [Candida pseudojiufengensis]KAI5959467.1 hypothetical protein KGF55_005295 [Candida pseudojiufengensis]